MQTLHVTRFQGARVSKRHYMSLKRHYRLLKTPLQSSRIFFLITRFLENQVSKERHFPNQFGKMGKMLDFFFLKEAFAHFLRDFVLPLLMLQTSKYYIPLLYYTLVVPLLYCTLVVLQTYSSPHINFHTELKFWEKEV